MDSVFDINNLSFNNSKITIILDDKDEPWFKAKDVATVLEYNDTKKAYKHIDEDDKKILENLRSSIGRPLMGNEKNTIYINESGLYSLILSSKKEEAKKFKKWITSIVLPSIRKHGEYKLKKEIEELTKKFKEQLYLKEQIIQSLSSIITNNDNKPSYIYIGSTELEKSLNYFKIGKTTRGIEERIKDYQIGRSHVNEFFLLDSFKCSDCHLVESLIKRRLKEFQVRGEMFHIPYDDLKSVIEETIKDCEHE